nr:xylosidase/arabinosidase [uncultured bacterium]
MKNQCFNPVLPPWEYIPDGEPHAFDGRVYIFGSHDHAHGYVYCPGDYICWSAPFDDLGDWRYEGVILKKTDDPRNKDGRMNLFAPDMAKGPDGRYYLYYVPDKSSVVSVAVCDTPAGKYEFLDFVRYPDGTILGEKDGDEPQFDPGVLVDGDVAYLYTGSCWEPDTTKSGMMATTLESDMLTVKEPPVIVVPSAPYSKGTQFEGHGYFEAPSIRKIGDTYYLVYSSVRMTELCYATSKSPRGGFEYGGAIISNCDLGIDTYKPTDKRTYPYQNNHGGMVEIGGKWYIFYHRHTHATVFSRQACAEPIEIGADGSIKQVEITSQGLNGKPLPGRGEYPAYIACNLFRVGGDGWISGEGGVVDGGKTRPEPRISQDGADVDADSPCLSCASLAWGATGNAQHIAEITDSTVIGFKYFDCAGVRKVRVQVRGYCNGAFEVKTAWDGESLGSIPVTSVNTWTWFSHDAFIPDGVNALYFVYKGTGNPSMLSFALE